MEIINLINDYYMVKFNTFSYHELSLIRGPWLLYKHYLTIRSWDLSFDLKDEIDKAVVWIQLLRLLKAPSMNLVCRMTEKTLHKEQRRLTRRR